MTSNVAKNEDKTSSSRNLGVNVWFQVGELLDNGFESTTISEMKNEVRMKLGLPKRMSLKEKLKEICKKHKIEGASTSQVLFELQSKGLI